MKTFATKAPRHQGVFNKKPLGALSHLCAFVFFLDNSKAIIPESRSSAIDLPVNSSYRNPGDRFRGILKKRKPGILEEQKIATDEHGRTLTEKMKTKEKQGPRITRINTDCFIHVSINFGFQGTQGVGINEEWIKQKRSGEEEKKKPPLICVNQCNLWTSVFYSKGNKTGRAEFPP